MLCWGCLFYLFPLIFGERERKRKGERQTDKQREENRLPADREKKRVGEGSDSGTVSKE